MVALTSPFMAKCFLLAYAFIAINAFETVTSDGSTKQSFPTDTETFIPEAVKQGGRRGRGQNLGGEAPPGFGGGAPSSQQFFFVHKVVRSACYCYWVYCPPWKKFWVCFTESKQSFGPSFLSDGRLPKSFSAPSGVGSSGGRGGSGAPSAPNFASLGRGGNAGQSGSCFTNAARGCSADSCFKNAAEQCNGSIQSGPPPGA